MEYKKGKNFLKILDKNDFNLQHILECGQIFSYEKEGEKYIVYSKDKKAEIFAEDYGYCISTESIEYFEDFFDLKTDYSKIKS